MSKKPAPSHTQDRFIIRLPEGMRERIAREAKLNGRSMNAEIVRVLEVHYPAPPPIEEVVMEIQEALDAIGKSNPSEKLDALSWTLKVLKHRLEKEFSPEDADPDTLPF